MTRFERIRCEMFLKVQHFGTAHRALFPNGSRGECAFTSLTDAMVLIDAHVQARPLAANEGQKERAIARQAVTDAMRSIARTSRGIDLAPGHTRKLLMPRRTSGLAVLNAARTFSREAEAVKDELIALGLPATCIIDLHSKMDVLERAMRGRRAGLVDVAGAGGGIKAAFRQAFTAIRILDIVVHNAVNGDAVLSAAWERSREIAGARQGRRARRQVVNNPAPISPASDSATG